MFQQSYKNLVTMFSMAASERRVFHMHVGMPEGPGALCFRALTAASTSKALGDR